MDTTNAIKIFGDKFFVRKTFDVIDYTGGIYGFDVLNDGGDFLFHIDGENKKSAVSEIKWKIYRSIL